MSTKARSETRPEKSQRPRHRPRTALIALAAVIVVAVVACALYFGDYYHAVDVDEALAGSGDVAVSETDGVWYFDGPGTEAVLVFYPGAKVEVTAYAPLMAELAAAGVDCLLVEMPLNFAIFGMGAAASLAESGDYDYQTWLIGGHSLGGAMAASCAASNPGTFDGVVLLAAYTTSSLADAVNWVVSLYGTEDGVLNLENVEAGRDLVPDDYIEIVIEGGNHAQFGSYGAQDGDGEATISAEEQLTCVVEAVVEALD